MSAYQRYECFNCNKDFDEAENGMCPYCHSTNISDRKEPQRKEFEQLTRPLIQFLNKNHNPHTKIIIDTTSAEVVSGEYNYITKEFIEG